VRKNGLQGKVLMQAGPRQAQARLLGI